jgi:hypothetical protein
LHENNPTLATKYLEVAESFDTRSVISDSIEVVKVSAKLSFLTGTWADCKRKYDTLIHLGNVAQDFIAIRESLLEKSMMFLFGNSRPSSMALAKELFNLSQDEDDWLGQFWGAHMYILNLLSSSNAEATVELSAITPTYKFIWEKAPHFAKQNPVFLICRQSLLAQMAMLNAPHHANLLALWTGFDELFEKIVQDDSTATFVGCLSIYHALFHGYVKETQYDPSTKALINKILDVVHKITKQGLHNSIISPDVKHLFKALKGLLNKKMGDAIKALQTGADTEGHTDAIYLQGLFHACIARVSEKKSEAESHLKSGRAMLDKVGATLELTKFLGL